MKRNNMLAIYFNRISERRRIGDDQDHRSRRPSACNWSSAARPPSRPGSG